MLEAHQFGRADIRREPDEEAAEIERLACCHGNAGGVEQLEQNIEHPRVRLFRFVKEQRPFDCPLAHPAEITTFTKTRAEQQAKRVLRLKLGHIEAEQLFWTEYLSGGHQDGFRFPDAGWSQQQKAPARAAGLGETEFTAADCGNDSRQDAGLTADFARQ